jgi:peptidoglycan/LPS O-acetylase OafA/YrhL
LVVFLWNKAFAVIKQKGIFEKAFDINSLAIFLLVLYWLQYGFIILNQKYFYFGFGFDLFNTHYFFPGFKWTGVIVFSYIIFLGTGMWIGFNYDIWSSINKWLRILIYPGAIISGWCYVWVTIAPYTFLNLRSEHAAMLKNTFILFISLMIYDVCRFIKNRGSEKVKNFLKSIGKYSFGIYLVHPLILDLLTRNQFFNRDESNYWVYLISKFIIFIFVMQLSWFVVVLLNKLPLTTRILFGKRRDKPTLLLAEKNS